MSPLHDAHPLPAFPIRCVPDPCRCGDALHSSPLCLRSHFLRGHFPAVSQLCSRSPGSSPERSEVSLAQHQAAAGPQQLVMSPLMPSLGVGPVPHHEEGVQQEDGWRETTLPGLPYSVRGQGFRASVSPRGEPLPAPGLCPALHRGVCRGDSVAAWGSLPPVSRPPPGSWHTAPQVRPDPCMTHGSLTFPACRLCSSWI